MRAVSLSNDGVLKQLKDNYIVGYKNITGASYAGRSGKHDPTAPAVYTTNGAGPHNVQLFFLSPEGTVLHCLLGFWDPRDLQFEMRFVQSQWKLWQSNRSLDEKKKINSQANLNILRQMSSDMIARSHLQGFDAKHELKQSNSDFVFQKGDYHPPYAAGAKSMKSGGNLKSTVQVIHERMSKLSFVAYADFNVASFSDYGREKYDKREETRTSTPAKSK